MAERVTMRTVHRALSNATSAGRACGALSKGEWLGTAVAWSMSYVCVYDVDGVMVRELSHPMPTRSLFEFAQGLRVAFDMSMAERRARLAGGGLTVEDVQ